jgi:hypothetical protein
LLHQLLLKALRVSPLPWWPCLQYRTNLSALHLGLVQSDSSLPVNPLESRFVLGVDVLDVRSAYASFLCLNVFGVESPLVARGLLIPSSNPF